MHHLLSKDEREVIAKLQSFTELSKATISDLFEILCAVSLVDNLNQRTIKIPYLGEVQIETTSLGVREVQFQPSPFLNTVLDQIESGAETSEIEKIVEKKILNRLQRYLSDED
jgi:hypothetical protein